MSWARRSATGAMSEVHHGRERPTCRDRRVKVLRVDLARDPSSSTASREAQNSAALNHPAIVAVYDTG